MNSHLNLRLLVLALAGALEWNATAQNVVFVPATGNWNVPGNWTSGSVPNTSQNPIVLNGGVVTGDTNVGSCGSVFAGQSAVANPKGLGLFRNGTVLTAANVLLGRDGTNYGSFNQMGGTLTVPSYVSVGNPARVAHRSDRHEPRPKVLSRAAGSVMSIAGNQARVERGL